MADNSTQAGNDTIRDIDKGGVKTQVFAIDKGGAGAESLATDTNPLPVISDPSSATFLERLALRALAKLTYTLTGVRVDCGGSSVAVSSLPTLANVTTVSTISGLGYNTQNGQSMQQSQLVYQCGFRRNIT